MDNDFINPLKLKVGDQYLKISSNADFEFALAGRTSIPFNKITQMMHYSSERLTQELNKVKQLENDLISILTMGIKDPISITTSMREINLNTYSLDHKWQVIMSALNDGGEEFTPLRRIALLYYTQYLSSCEQSIEYLFSIKNQLLEKKTKDDKLFDSTQVLSTSKFKIEDFKRLTKDSPVTFNLSLMMDLEILISYHYCKIIKNDHLQFIDHKGKRHPLKKGRNTIGRDPENDVIFDDDLSDISRLHLVVENIEDRILKLTDVSTNGTSVQKKLI